MSIIVSGSTHIGMKRKTNQDSICLYPSKFFFAVADGMGGHNGGDIASQMSVKCFKEYLDKNHQKSDSKTLLSNAIRFVNSSIYEYGQKNEELKGMGTTISSILFDKGTLNVGNVGDSRTYLFNKSNLYQLTRDHSLVQEKINMGFYNRIDARKDPQKNVLIRTVGFEPEVEVDVYQYKVSKNDLFMICSDGLHGKVSDSDIQFTLSKLFKRDEITQEDLDLTVADLITQANNNGGQDNISVILVHAR